MPDNLKDYEEGFNHGYILQKHAPELAELISNSQNPKNSYFSGFTSGKQEHQMEQIRVKFHKQTKPRDPEKDKDK